MGVIAGIELIFKEQRSMPGITPIRRYAPPSPLKGEGNQAPQSKIIKFSAFLAMRFIFLNDRRWNMI